MGSGSAVAYASQCLLAACFLAAGVNKFRSLRQFELSLQRIAFVPRRVVPLVAIVLPVVETSAGVLLAANTAVRPVAALIIALLVAFSLALGDLLRKKVDYQCMCFGAASKQSVTWATVGRNLMLIAGAVLVASTAPIDLGSSLPPHGLVAAVVSTLTGLLMLGATALVLEVFKASATSRRMPRVDEQQHAHA